MPTPKELMPGYICDQWRNLKNNDITVYDHKLQIEDQTHSGKIEEKLMEVNIPQAYYYIYVFKSHGIVLKVTSHT